MTKERLPWFPCYPDKLLGALAAMEPDEGYIYVIMLMRIYEAAGPVEENPATLSRRSGMSLRRTQKALDWLLERGKLITADGLISNPKAEDLLNNQASLREARIQKAKQAANAKHQKDKQKQQNGDARSSAKQSILDLEKDSKKETMKEKKSARAERADRATRIPDDWKLTSEMGNYGRGRGLSSREVINEAEKFLRYWRGKGGERGRKVDWKSTWENWCINAAERLGRVARDAPMEIGATPDTFDAKTWENIAVLFESTQNWQLKWGPEPGSPGCLMPPDLWPKKL